MPTTDSLKSVLTTFFQTKSYATHCGSHWKDRAATPAQVAKESIIVERIPHSESESAISGVTCMYYDVRSLQPHYVYAHFNLCRVGDEGTHRALPILLLDFFQVKKFINMGVDFAPTRVWFVIKKKARYYHVSFFPKIGQE